MGEHARSDRDLYIKIVEKNVRPGKFANFRTMRDGETSRNFDYDYSSIMHYGPYFFSKNKRDRVATIVPKNPGVEIGQREMLSKTDCMKINSLYGCFKDPATCVCFCHWSFFKNSGAIVIHPLYHCSAFEKFQCFLWTIIYNFLCHGWYLENSSAI